jgi:hypothetical protein
MGERDLQTGVTVAKTRGVTSGAPPALQPGEGEAKATRGSSPQDSQRPSWLEEGALNLG